MKKSLALALCLSLVVFSAGFAWAKGGAGKSVARDYSGYNIAVGNDQGVMLQSSGTVGMSKAAGDTFYLYGGPGSVLGKFQQILAFPGGATSRQGWIGIDYTEQQPSWRATNNPIFTTTLDPGGYVAADQHDGTDYVGYGNAWNHWLILNIDMSALNPAFNPATDVTNVGLTFQYVHDSEPNYDYLWAEWQQGGAWQTLMQVDDSSYNPTTMTYNVVNANFAFTYNGGQYNIPVGSGYTGAGGNTYVVLRLRGTSDGAWSDQDGLFSTGGRGIGAVDNVAVNINLAPASVADFSDLGGGCGDCAEGDFTGHDVGAGTGTPGWTPTPSEFVGDFSKVYGQMTDIDVCRSNATPQMTFIDDNTLPNQLGGTPPSLWGGSTGSATYGVPGFYVLNYTGGLTFGNDDLDNSVWSPPFNYDLPGTADDVANGGAFLRYTTWNHLPLLNGMFRVWSVRSHNAVEGWSSWNNNNFVYYANAAAYANFQIDVTNHMLQSPDLVQIEHNAVDLANLFGFPGSDATPSPTLDNVTFAKYRIAGPVFSTRTIDILGDGFANDGSLTGSIRVDMNRDVAADSGPNIPGDSMIVDVIAVIPFSTIQDPPGGYGGTMHWKMRVDPYTGGARTWAGTNATLAGTVTGPDGNPWEVWQGSVVGGRATTNGVWVEDRYYWDLPDGPKHVDASYQVDEPTFFWPGDIVQYYVKASDNFGNTTTIPGNIDGWGDFDDTTAYSRTWTIRGLPTIIDDGLPKALTHPTILLWNDFGHRGFEDEWLKAMQQNGLREGVHYDTYTTKGPSSLVSNGLGSAGSHGAVPDQLIGYSCMLYESGNLNPGLISDGSNASGNDKGNDVATVQGWHDQAFDRGSVYFGDDFSEAMTATGQGATTQAFLNGVLGVNHIGPDVSPKISGQVTPIAHRTAAFAANFATPYMAYGGCLVINDFDDMGLEPGAAVAHEFLNTSCGSYSPAVPASIVWDREEPAGSGIRKVTMTFAHAFGFIQDPQPRPGCPTGPGNGKSARANVLGEIIQFICGDHASGPAVGTTPSDDAKLLVKQNTPNPFNPTTKIAYNAPHKGHMLIEVFDVAGRLVTTLQNGIVDAGEGFVIWNGRDASGSQVASGVYLYQVKFEDEVFRGKMALVK